MSSEVFLVCYELDVLVLILANHVFAQLALAGICFCDTAAEISYGVVMLPVIQGTLILHSVR
jgi:hypothetical protein